MGKSFFLVIAFVELAERFSYYGSTVVFTNFIQQPLPAGSRTGSNPDGQPGALGMGQRASTGLTTFNTFWVYVIPLFGAYVADTYWGRFKTISVSVVIAMVGHVLLIISAVPGVIEKSNAALAVFVIAILTMGLGTGGFKSNISPLVAEQYKRTKLFIGNTKKGEKVIVDPGMTTTRIYMVRFLLITSNMHLCLPFVYSTFTCSSTSVRSSARSAWSTPKRTSGSGSPISSPPPSLPSARSCFSLAATATRARPLRALCSRPPSAYGATALGAAGPRTPSRCTARSSPPTSGRWASRAASRWTSVPGG